VHVNAAPRASGSLELEIGRRMDACGKAAIAAQSAIRTSAKHRPMMDMTLPSSIMLIE
jgi:hypothetical protein